MLMKDGIRRLTFYVHQIDKHSQCPWSKKKKKSTWRPGKGPLAWQVTSVSGTLDLEVLPVKFCWLNVSAVSSSAAAVIQSLSHVRLTATPWTAAARLPCSSGYPWVCSNLCPLSWWCHPAICPLPSPSLILNFSTSFFYKISTSVDSATLNASVTAVLLETSFPHGAHNSLLIPQVLLFLKASSLTVICSQSTCSLREEFFNQHQCLWFQIYITDLIRSPRL